MPQPFEPVDISRLPGPGERRSVLGPADPTALAFAAEELRERTMQFEPEEPLVPRPRLFWAAMAGVVFAAGLLLVFGRPLREALGLG
jgi:hypothetical protein